MMVGTQCSSLDFFFFYLFILYRDFSGGSDSKESACNVGDSGLIPGSGRSPWRREWLPTLVFLPGEFHGQKSLAGHSPWGHKELDMSEQQLQLISNVVIVSGTQQRDSAIYVHVSILSQTPLPSRLSHNIDQSFLCCAVGPFWLSILNTAVCTC